jgi:hypothetical protein
MRLSSLRPWFLVLGLCLLRVSRADAQELDDQTRSAARELATEGSALYQKGDFEGAYDRFSRAYQLVQKPNVGIWAARSLVRGGHWVEASERYLELERTALPGGAPPDQVQAVADAAKERRDLLGRVPSIKVIVEGADPSSVFVSLNGQLVKPALIGAKQPVNPGKLLVKGVRGEQVVEASIELGEAQFREVRLVFAGAATPAAAPAAGDPTGPAAANGSAAALTASPSDHGSNLRLYGFIGLGVGGAALATGAIFGGLAASDKSDLDTHCPNHRCQPDFHDLNDSYATKKTIASIGIIGGAVLAGAGAVLILTAPASASSQGRGLTLRGYATVTGGGVMGAF